MNAANETRPVKIGLTMGDPSGIGPEILVKVFANSGDCTDALCFVAGRPAVMQRAVDLLGVDFTVKRFADVASIVYEPGTIPVIEVGDDDADRVQPRTIEAAGGQAAFDSLKFLADLAISDQIDALVTTPLNKKALRAAGIEVPGHTELLARFCNIEQVAMMLHLPAGFAAKGEIGLSVAHVSLHTALRNVFAEITLENVVEKCRLIDNFCSALLRLKQILRQPRIALAALNPHGGEQGLFGREEIEIISPAAELCRAEGIKVTGPEPCDTLMRRAAQGEFDGVVAMYHDQGHIALKLLDMFSTVNITLGLPIIRTSVAHGTADDIAWTGKATSQSLQQAIAIAADLARDRIQQETRPPRESGTLLR